MLDTIVYLQSIRRLFKSKLPNIKKLSNYDEKMIGNVVREDLKYYIIFASIPPHVNF